MARGLRAIIRLRTESSERRSTGSNEGSMRLQTTRASMRTSLGQIGPVKTEAIA
jgi:hypothetical protein